MLVSCEDVSTIHNHESTNTLERKQYKTDEWSSTGTHQMNNKTIAPTNYDISRTLSSQTHCTRRINK